MVLSHSLSSPAVATHPSPEDPEGRRVAEAPPPYPVPSSWVDVLVDCPGVEGLFTYRIPAGMVVQPGDILSVPFSHQQVGAITIRGLDHLPPDRDPKQLRDVEAVISVGFFPADYWTLLDRVAEHYHTSLMQVIRVALTTGSAVRDLNGGFA